MNAPKYNREDKVRFRFPRRDTVEEHVGVIVVVDVYGTMEQNEEPSYDIQVPEIRQSISMCGKAGLSN